MNLKWAKTDFESPTISGNGAENNFRASKDQPSKYFPGEDFQKSMFE